MSDRERLLQLEKIFQEFMLASRELENSYAALQNEARLLSTYLGTVLENLPEAILIFDNQNYLALANQNARLIFPDLMQKLSRLEQVLAFLGISSNKRIFKPIRKEVTLNRQKRWLEIMLRHFFNDKNEKTGQILIISDKTEIVLMDQKNQQEERLTLMGKVAAEMAHDIRNPLASIELMFGLLAPQLPPVPENLKTLEHIRKALFHINRLITNILFFSRNFNTDMNYFEITKLIEEIETELFYDLKTVNYQKRIENCTLSADFLLLKQAIINLLNNALQSIPRDRKGEIEIIVSTKKEEQLQIIIKDNGCGIANNQKKNIFQPFFSTKTNGTGLGLAIVKRIIDAHSGTISFRSGRRGTSFKIILPLK